MVTRSSSMTSLILCSHVILGRGYDEAVHSREKLSSRLTLRSSGGPSMATATEIFVVKIESLLCAVNHVERNLPTL